MDIKRILNRQSHTFTLTETELEQAYRIMEKRYLEEDFVNTMSNSLHEPDSRFHSGHLDEFPELLNWLCSCFHHFFDANMSHNDILQLILNHLNHSSLEPQFFWICPGLFRQTVREQKRNCPTVSRTAACTTTAIILLRQGTEVPGGKCWPPSSPCTKTAAASAAKKLAQENALRQNT